MRAGIIAGGNWIVDRVKTIDRFPEEQTLSTILSQSNQNGGGPFNVLVDLARLGATFPLEGIGLIGDDQDGEFILETCRENGIDTTQISKAPASTSYTDVMAVPSTGRRTFFHHRGANALLDVPNFDFTQTTAKHFHLGYLLLLDTLDQPDPEFGTRAGRVLDQARKAGLSTSIDAVSESSYRFPEIVLPTLPHADICFLNEFELSRTLGIYIPEDANQTELETAAHKLFEAGLRELAVIHSAKFGFATNQEGQSWYLPSLDVPEHEIKGTVGAGDAFAAGFLFAHHEGHDAETALDWATRAAARSLRGEGASNGITSLR